MNHTPALSATDQTLLARCVELAVNGCYTTTPNPRVGCVICKNGTVIAEAWHEAAGEPHAEIAALTKAGGHAAGADIYLSLEPCAHHGKTPPCTDALIAAKPARVIVAMPDPNPQVSGRGFAALAAAGISVCRAAPESAAYQAAWRLNIGFISRMLRHRPWLRLKIAASLDGKTALTSGLSRWITGTAARQDAHHLRAVSCAVLTGIGTAEQDNPQLTVRHVSTTRQPLRLLLDSHHRADTNMQLFADDNILVVGAAPPPSDFPAAVLTLPTAEEKVDLTALMRELAEREINEVLIEAGRQLNGALLAEELADEIVLYQAGRIFGDSGRDMFHLPPPATPQDAPLFSRTALTEFSDGDIKIVYQREKSLAQCQLSAS